MSKVVPILILTTIAPALACLHLVRELRQEREQTASLQARIDELEKDRAAAEAFTVIPRTSPFSAPTEQVGAAAVPRTQARAEQAAVAAVERESATPQDVRERIRAHMEQRREMMKQPQYREAMRTQARLDMRRNYPGLMQELQMTREEVDGLFDLLADQQVRSMEESESMFLQGDQPDEAQVRAAQERFQARAEQQRMELETYLGPKYEQWVEYQQTLGQRHRLVAVQSTLALGGTPLNDKQAKTLLSALVQEQRRQQQQWTQVPATNVSGNAADGMAVVNSVGGNFPGFEDWLEQQEQSNERLLNTVRSDLSSKQFQQLKEMLDSELEIQRTHLELQKAQGELPSRIGVPRAGIIGGFAPIAPVGSVTTRAVVISEPPSTSSSGEVGSR